MYLNALAQRPFLQKIKGRCWPSTKTLLVMKLTFLFLTSFLLQVSAKTFSQKISFSGKNVTLETVFEAIENQTGYVFFYNAGLLNGAKPVSVNLKDVSVEALLRECLRDQPLRFVIRDKTISLRGKALLPEKPLEERSLRDTGDKRQVVTGRITDETGKPVAGVSVLIKGSTGGTTTNQDGIYVIELSPKEKTLLFTSIGMRPQEITVGNRTTLNVVMVNAVEVIDDMVVTGFYKKSKSSFTGAAVTFTGEELKGISPTNLIQALSIATPGLSMVTNNNFGSNPNVLPEILVRGVTSFASTSTGQGVNQPLVVRDGTIISIQDLYDMNINEIASVTVLKDASAAAVYGAKAANGVIVIERRKIENGKMKVTYNATSSIQFPDFKDYNILNGRDKLEYERLAGLYSSEDPTQQYIQDSLYNERYKIVSAGMSTDWMKKPARVGYSMDHSLRFSGGSQNTRYELNARFGNTEGVMKGDYRKRYGIGFMLEYYPRNGVVISNRTTLNEVRTQASPYGSFSKYTYANPYDLAYDRSGKLIRDLSWAQENPLYEASLSSYNRGETQAFSNDFDARWQINNNFRFTTHLNISTNNGWNSSYLSPLSRAYRDETDNSKKGSLTKSDSKGFLYSGNMVLSYNKIMQDKSLLTANVGANINRDDILTSNFRGVGYYSDDLRSIGFAAGYPLDERPSGSQDLSTDVGSFLNLNYTYRNRYYFDGVYQISGSSKFGANNRYGQFWSTGLGWNLHNEDFAKVDWISLFKLRGSVGYTGKVNFASYQSLTTYRYQNSLEYRNGIGAVPLTIGNPDLKWERTMNYNLGLDLSLWNRRFNLTADVYNRRTTDLLIDMTIAPSSGVMTGKSNLGEMENKGVEVRIDGYPIQNKTFSWLVGVTVSHNTNKILKISEALKSQNDFNNTIQEGTPLPQFNEGESIMALKVVRSLGIDPATGKEVFLKLNGEKTFTYDPKDKVVVGDGMPKFNGTFFSNLSYRRFSLAPYMSFNYGGYIYNTTKIRKIEGSDPQRNADQRVFDSRWKNPGDVASYRDIADQSSPKQTTRFVEKDNTIELSRLNLSYEVGSQFTKRLGISKMSAGVSVNNLFRLSTVEMERGTEYLFSRGFDLTLNVIF